MHKMLKYLKENGGRLDFEIALAVGFSLAETRAVLAELTEQGTVISCQITRYSDDEKTEEVSYRASE